jgi:hypothetical protein
MFTNVVVPDIARARRDTSGARESLAQHHQIDGVGSALPVGNSLKDFCTSRIVFTGRRENTPSLDVFGHNPESRLGMKTLAVISILALLAISGAVYTDLLLTSDRHSAQMD